LIARPIVVASGSQARPKTLLKKAINSVDPDPKHCKRGIGMPAD